MGENGRLCDEPYPCVHVRRVQEQRRFAAFFSIAVMMFISAASTDLIFKMGWEGVWFAALAAMIGGIYYFSLLSDRPWD